MQLPQSGEESIAQFFKSLYKFKEVVRFLSYHKNGERKKLPRENRVCHGNTCFLAVFDHSRCLCQNWVNEILM